MAGHSDSHHLVHFLRLSSLTPTPRGPTRPDPARVTLLWLIAAAGDDGVCVCDLIAPMRLSQPTVSHHMRQLVDAGLITPEQRGKWAYYRLVHSTFVAIAGALAPLEMAGAGQGQG